MKWHRLTKFPLGARPGIGGIDAHLVWADASAWRDYRPAVPSSRRIPVLAELAPGGFDLFRQIVGAKNIPAVYGKGSRFVTARLNVRACGLLLSLPPPLNPVVRFELAAPYIPRRPVAPAGLAGAAAAAPSPQSGAEVIIGLIDHGCPFAHAALRNGMRTRVLALWMQDEVQPAQSQAIGTVPAGFGYGLQLASRELDAIIRAKSSGSGAIDEAACHDAAGLVDLRHEFAHGAAVLSALAGSRPPQARLGASLGGCEPPGSVADAAVGADIVFVQPPRDALQDSSSGGLGRHIVDALHYILGCAGPKTRKVVVNISDGSSRGSHDGAWLLTDAIDDFVNAPHVRKERSVVIGAGNARQEMRHAQFERLEPGRWHGLPFRLMPGSESVAQIVVRIPAEATDIELRVVPPGADPATCRPAVPGTAIGWPAATDPECAVIYPARGPRDAVVALVTWAPTVRVAAGQACAVPGDWQIELRSKAGTDLPVHLYVPRAQRNPPAAHRAVQSRFVDDTPGGFYDPQRWQRHKEDDQPGGLSPIRRGSTLNALASGAAGRGIEAVGARFFQSGRPTPYSGAGPSVPPSSSVTGPGRLDVDCSRPVDISRELRGFSAGGTTGGQIVRVTGTSFAAPQRAREIANG
jgi:hypothetical protein